MFGSYIGSQTAAGAFRRSVNVEIGEMTAYDPLTHSGTFQLPLHPDNLTTSTDDSQTFIDTGMIPIGTLFTGPGFGMRFVPTAGTPEQTGSQALIVFSDDMLEHPLCALFFFNNVETPPFTDVNTNGWQDSLGNQVTTNDDTGMTQLTGINDAALVAPQTGLGDIFANLGPDNAVVTVGMLRIVTDIFNEHSHGGVQNGTGTSGPPLQQQTPQGSSTVRAKE